MPSLFARHRHTRSTDTTTSSPTNPASSTYQPTHLRKPSLTDNNGPPPAASASASSGLLGNLKAKLNASRVSLHEDDAFNGSGGAGGKRRFSIGQILIPKDTSEGGLNGGRRNSIAMGAGNGTTAGVDSSPTFSRNYPPGTVVMPTPKTSVAAPGVMHEGDEDRQRGREAADLLDLDQDQDPNPISRLNQATATRSGSQNGSTGQAGLDAWKPLVPDFKGRSLSPPTSPPISPTPVRVISSTNTTTSTTTMSPRTNRVPPGRIALPPPGLISRKSTASHGMGLSIVPSTPLPQRIANLPTLNGSASGTSDASATPGYGFPGANMVNGVGSGSGAPMQGSASRPGSSHGGAGSLQNSPGLTTRSASDARWAKKAMPVMLREPSHRPVAPVVASPEQEGSDDSDSQESSESESGSDVDDDDDSSEEGGSSAMMTRAPGGRTSLGEVEQRGLLGRRERVDSIHEDPEEDQQAVSPGEANRRRLAALSIPDRRQLVAPRLDGLPQNLVSAQSQAQTQDSTAQMPSQSRTSSSSWALPTPRTPGANQFFSGGAGWTQFGAATPTIGTPMGSPTAKTPGQAALGAFAMPNGVAKAAALSRNQTPAAGVKVDETSYFDTARPVRDGNATPTPSSARPVDSNEDGEDDIEEVSTPRAEDPESLSSSATQPPAPVTVAPLPMDLSNLPGMVPASRDDQVTSPIRETLQSEGSAAGSRPTTPMTSRPMMLKHRSRSMVDLSAAASPSWRQPAESVSRRPSAEDDHAASPVEPTQRHEISPVGMIPIGESLREHDPSPAPSTRSSADWARPPPTPGIGMTQPFRFGTATPSGTSTPITPKKTVMQRQMSDAKGSPLKRRRSLDDTRVKPPKYEPPEPRSGIPGPREEEGRESLPEYWCHVHIEGYLPRKMEFSAPGVQARDRSWKRLYFVLHGTSLRVFKHDVHRIPFKDTSSISIPEVSEADLSNLHVHKPGERRESVSAVGTARPGVPAAATGRRGSLVEGSINAPMGRRGSLPGSDPDAISPAARRTSQSSVGSSIATATTTTSSEKDMSLFHPVSQARRASVSVPPPAPSSGINARENIASHLPFGGGNAMVKQYSLQNAESGLAADYVKKRNVVRVRAEGEQFLLQTDSAKDVVDWIEAFQAATNVSLELDTRPMPKIITLPRRRRRRRPGEAAAGAAAAQPGVAENDDTPEGNARAVEQAERAAAAANARESNSRNVNAMEAMLAEDQAAA